MWGKKKKEERADTQDRTDAPQGAVGVDDVLLRAALGDDVVTRDMALQVPAVSGGLDLIASVIASTPIKLYRESDGRAEDVVDDPRVVLLNDETGDTLNANDFWRAMIYDYYLGKGGFAYIHRERGAVKSLHYVRNDCVSMLTNADPIYKDYDILVGGTRYKPFDFLRVLRNTRDGMTGTPITTESSRLIQTAYHSLIYECNMVRKGGNKKGFLKAAHQLSDAAMTALKAAFRRLYSNNSENVVVLNGGVEFQEASNTAVEMQLNESKVANANDFAKIFHVSANIIGGTASQADIASLARLAAIPLMQAIQCALNRDMLLEREKGTYYWAFDTKELLKGDMKTRFDAYKTALDANFMQIDEVRFAEDLEPLGLKWIRLGLNDVLYDPKTKQIYTPNTDKTNTMDGNPMSAEDSDGKGGDKD